MSTLNPNKYGGQQLKGKTSLAEIRVADANAQLPYDSSDLQVAGNAQPASVNMTPAANSVNVDHGVVSVTHERHMSERSSGWDYTIQDTTKLLNELGNMSSLKPSFTQATQGWTSSTIALGSTAFQLTVASTTGLTTNDKVYAIWNAGTVNEREEERLVANIPNNTTINLQKPFSAAPQASTLLKRAIATVTLEGGGDYKEWTHNMKKTGDDSSVHILHHPSAVVMSAQPLPPSNSAILGHRLTWAANAYEYITNLGESVPAFSAEYDIPRNVALGINL